jgi:RNA-directed DNA polymerase
MYLHYVLDLWFEKRIKRQSKGEAHIIRYADDFVCCFQYEEDARSFYQTLRERLLSLDLASLKKRRRSSDLGNKQKTGTIKMGEVNQRLLHS